MRTHSNWLTPNFHLNVIGLHIGEHCLGLPTQLTPFSASFFVPSAQDAVREGDGWLAYALRCGRRHRHRHTAVPQVQALAGAQARAQAQALAQLQGRAEGQTRRGGQTQVPTQGGAGTGTGTGIGIGLDTGTGIGTGVGTDKGSVRGHPGSVRGHQGSVRRHQGNVRGYVQRFPRAATLHNAYSTKRYAKTHPPTEWAAVQSTGTFYRGLMVNSQRFAFILMAIINYTKAVDGCWYLPPSSWW